MRALTAGQILRPSAHIHTHVRTHMPWPPSWATTALCRPAEHPTTCTACPSAGASQAAGPLKDFCLVPSGDDDMDFFCTDYSTELLEAAGIRNDNGDYFKVKSCWSVWGEGPEGSRGVGVEDGRHV